MANWGDLATAGQNYQTTIAGGNALGNFSPTQTPTATPFNYSGSALNPSGWAPEYSQANIADLTNQLAAILEPQYQRSGKQVLANMGGTLGTATSNPLQLMENNRMGQLAQFAQGLQTAGLGAGREERLLGEQRLYEQPFREAPITGAYGGSPTASYSNSLLPYVTSGLMNKDVLGSTLGGATTTERAIDPTWWASNAGGFQSPYTQSQYMANPDQYQSIYGTKPVARTTPTDNYNYYSPTGAKPYDPNNFTYTNKVLATV